MSTIDFIGGEKGGVGKSVVARLVAQYCIDRGFPFVALDADESHGTLRRHYGEQTHAVDLGRAESADQIVVLATEAERRVVVDLPAQSDRLLSGWMAESAVLELTRECGVRVAFWHVIDDGKDSVLTLDRLLSRFGDSVSYRIVKNLGRGSDFSGFDRSSTRSAAEALGALVIDLPELNATAMQKIDRNDASFWASINNTALSDFTRMDRQRIKVWVQAAFDRLAPAFAS